MKSVSICFVALAAISTSGLAQVDPSLLHGLEARSIGPAGMSGRVAAIDAVVEDPNIIFVGSATGGVWKSVDGGLTWNPVFDDQPTSSIGAVAIFQANPDIVWIGTGEGNPRNSAGVGFGVYKSMDGGRSWSVPGLTASERIHRIVLHPSDPDIAYVAALGPTWSDAEERGVFKTTDGGKSWQRVLYVNQRTGAADLVMDPGNPNKLFAAMWEHRRSPWFFESGGPGSGLYVTHDGGATWKMLTTQDGLPEGDLGRIGLAFAHNNPNVVYALVEATRSALLRSDDGGHSWQMVNDSVGIAPRPFYYADLRIDPLNENRLYSIHGRATVSEDGGKSFRTLVESSLIHGDVHELWIHPTDSRLLMMGNDGGVGISYDRGTNWRFVANLPLAQFYHINVDMATPFNVYGGLQDNGSWFGPSAVWLTGGIRNYYWTRVGSGDGFATLNDFSDSRYGYSMSQRGFLRRFDKVTGERKDIQPVHPDSVALRFSWNAAFNVDPFDSTTIYLGSQFIHKSTDRGNTWEIISSDLTTNDPAKQRPHESGGLTRDATGAENHTTILTIAPSPVEAGVIWVGTDDGNVQITTDGGATWTTVTDRIRGVPAATWVPHIEPSKFDGGTAFVVFDDHRRGNWTPYVLRTIDYGRNWRSLSTDELSGFVHVIEQDPEHPDLLYLGTEFGMYVSLNGGRNLMRWRHGVPTVPVRALMVHPRDHDLVIGTHGRGVFILDDVQPLRALSRRPALAQSPIHLFDPPPAVSHEVPDAIGYRSTGHSMFSGENRPYGALLTYSLGTGSDTAKVQIEILDANGAVIRSMEGPGKRGVNRASWNLETDSIRSPTRTGLDTLSGPEVVPGTYTVRITAGAAEATAAVEVVPDPRVDAAVSERRAKFNAIVRAGQRVEVATEAVERIRSMAKALDGVLEVVTSREDSVARRLTEAGRALKKKLATAAEAFVYPAESQGIFASGRTVSSKLTRVYRSLQSSWDMPTEAQELALTRADAALERALATLNRFIAEDMAAFRAEVDAAGLELFTVKEPLSVDWKRN